MPYCLATLISDNSARASDDSTTKNASSDHDTAWWTSFLCTSPSRSDTSIISAGDPRHALGAATGRDPKEPRARSRAFVKTRQHELAVPERFRCGEPPVYRAKHHRQQLVACFVHRHLALQQPRHVEVDVLAHRPHRPRIRAQLDHRQDRVADDIALPG